MISTRIRALLVLPLLAFGGWLGALSDEARATPRPPAGAASLVGGFSAVAVQVFWMRADRALRDRRMDEALYYFGLIHRLEPQLISAASYFAAEIGVNMADLEPDPNARGALGMLAVRMLDRTVAENSDQAKAYVVRGQFLLTKIAREPAKASQFLEERRITPNAAARDDFRRAVALDGSSIEAMYHFAVASQQRGEELFFVAYARGDGPALAIARDIFRDSEAAYAALIELQLQKHGDDPRLDQAPEREERARAARWVALFAGGARGLDAAYRAFWEENERPAGWPEPR